MRDDHYALAHELATRDEPFAIATVVRAEAPSSGKPGDRAIVTADGVMHGWIGGSCAQPTVIDAALAALGDGHPRLLRIAPESDPYGPREEVEEVVMTCASSGTLEIFVEPRRPRPRLLVVGGLPIARSLARLGKDLDFRVLTVDPASDSGRVEPGGDPAREAPGDGPVALASVDEIGADETAGDPAAIERWTTAATWVVVACHGPHDERAALRALRAGAPYVALVASRKRAAEIRAFLRREGLGDDALARLEAPAGLDLGARHGDEIALSILAAIVALRRGRKRVVWEAPAGYVAPASIGEAASAMAETTAHADDRSGSATPAPAVDPVCGMTVKITAGAPRHEHDGVVYYFCCGGCRESFVADPSRYVAVVGDS